MPINSKHVLLAGAAALCAAPVFASEPKSYGQRPFFFSDKLDDGPLKERLTFCKGQTPQMS